VRPAVGDRPLVAVPRHVVEVAPHLAEHPLGVEVHVHVDESGQAQAGPEPGHLRVGQHPTYSMSVPEGHTVHRLAARHRELFAGRRVTVSSPQGRFAGGAALLSGRVLRDTAAVGKHLLHRYPGGRTLHVHLGLYGRFTDGTGDPPAPVGEVRLRMVGRGHWLDLRGPAACEVLAPPEVDALLARLGPDPLRADADPERAYARIRASDRPIAALLMDQSIEAGPGVIYVTEVLFRAGLPPTTPGRSLDPVAWQGIW